MGKATGFMDYDRRDAECESPKERIKHFREFHTPLSKEEQELLYDAMESEACTPSHDQAIRMRNLSKEGKLTEDIIMVIMSQEKPNQVEQWKIPKSKLKKYFPSGTSQEKIEETIIKALELYRKREKTRER